MAPPPSVLFTTARRPKRRSLRSAVLVRAVIPVALAAVVIVSPLLAPTPVHQGIIGSSALEGIREAMSSAVSQAVGAPADTPPPHDPPAYPHPRYRHSIALGLPYAGHLESGVQLPARARHYYTWDFPKRHSPSRGWRRWGTAKLVHTIVAVTTAYAKAHPHAPKIGIADMSKPHGGPFGAEKGSLGHDSHQNGLDVDILYPRKSKGKGPPHGVGDIDHKLAQDLVNRFVRAGAQFVFVGPHTGLHGPPGVVQTLVYHDDHMHVRIR
jgi:hypothetical protein